MTASRVHILAMPDGAWQVVVRHHEQRTEARLAVSTEDEALDIARRVARGQAGRRAA